VGKVKGNSEEARSINQYLDSLKQKVYDYQKNIVMEGKHFTKEMLRLKWYGIEQQTYTLVQVFRQHNDQLKSLIGKDNSKATYTKYRTTLDHTISFLEWKFKRSDIEISSINYNFITDFEFWLKSVQNCNHNTTIKYISNLRKIINGCLKNGWLVKDPFIGFKMTKKEVIRDIGQMQMYVNYYDRKIKLPDENPTIGIILCKEENKTVVEFTLPENNKTIFAKEYKLYLPSKEQLKKQLE
jgi:hypothetical protein